MAKARSNNHTLKSTASADRVAATTEAAEEVVAMETNRQQASENEQQQRERIIAQAYQIIGRIETANFFAKMGDVASLQWAQEFKDSKIYKKIPEIGTWENFCKIIGISRRAMDEKLQNRSVFGDEFLATAANLKIGYRELRKLRGAAKDGQLLIEDNTVEINGSRIPLDSDHAEDLQAEIETLIDAKDRVIEEREATLKAKDRVLEEKEKVIQRQEEVIAEHEKTLKQRGFAPGEEEFLNDIENFSHTVQGLCLMVDPSNLPENPTPVMTSAYIETLGRAWRTMKGYYDGACERFGDPLDDDWVPPNLRDDSANQFPTTDEPMEHPCPTCSDRKAKSSKKKGVLIPDQYGKCTREGGLCERYRDHTQVN